MDHNLRILHVYKTFIPDSMGGVEQVIAQLVRSSAQGGHDVRVASLGQTRMPTQADFEGAEHWRYRESLSIASNAMSWQLLRDYSRLADWADVIHYHFPWPFGDLLHLFWGSRKPSVVSYHSDIVRQKALLTLYRPLMHAFFRRVDRIVATSPNYVESSALLRQYKDKTTVIPIGIDDKLYPKPSQGVIDHWKRTVGQGFFLFVGVIRYYKGLHILLEAVRNSSLPVVIVGAGPSEQGLRELARKWNLNNVRFLGFLPDEDKIALLQLCRAVVFPSHLRSEAFGVSLLEGAMLGKPLISSELGTGTSYVNQDGETGFVVPPSTPQAFREAMEKLQGDDALVERFGRAARERYERLFRSEMMFRGYRDLYDQLLCTRLDRRFTAVPARARS
jgi:glycosyltransferase involved in cell wall biosynthesis